MKILFALFVLVLMTASAFKLKQDTGSSSAMPIPEEVQAKLDEITGHGTRRLQQDTPPIPEEMKAKIEELNSQRTRRLQQDTPPIPEELLRKMQADS